MKLLKLFFVILLVGLAIFLINHQELRKLKSINNYHEFFLNKIGFSLEEVQIIQKGGFCANFSAKNILDESMGKSILNLPLADIAKKIKAHDCVDDVMISKILPSTLNITIFSKEPIAIWHNTSGYKFITTKGELMSIKQAEKLDEFIVATGASAPEHAPKIINILNGDLKIKSRINNIEWVGERRWNINLQNGLEIMLPEKDPEIAWQKFLELENIEELTTQQSTAKTIDLRFQGKFIIKQDGKSAEKVKS
jgi:cell division protein FtsQ